MDINVDVDDARYQVEEQTTQLAVVVDEYRSKIGVIPPDAQALYAAWRSLRPGEEEPLDPFDGSNYGYYVTDDGFVIWSSGPDGAAETEDDILKEFPLEQCPDSLLWFTSSTSGTGRTSPLEQSGGSSAHRIPYTSSVFGHRLPRLSREPVRPHGSVPIRRGGDG